MTPSARSDPDRWLAAQLVAFGPFFEVAVHAPGERPGPAWQPMSELVEGGLERRVQAVRAALAAGALVEAEQVDQRVAASVAQLGLVARVLAVAISTVVIKAVAVGLRPAELWWQDTLGGPYPLSIALTEQRWTGLPAGSVIEAITAGTATAFGVSDRVLWGNVGSAANSAAALIAAARPGLAAPARTAADLILADPRVDSGRLRSGSGFRRRSCCLIYRISGSRAAVCGDCVLERR